MKIKHSASVVARHPHQQSLIRSSAFLCWFGFLSLLFLPGWAGADDEDFHDQDLKVHDFSKGNHNRANFSDARLDHANFTSANLKKANFKDAHVDAANFYMANLTGANFSGATGTLTLAYVEMSGAILEPSEDGRGLTLNINGHVTLRGAHLQKCKIIGVGNECNFAGADLRGANLRAGSISSTAIFTKAIYDDDTAWPDGFDPKKAGCEKR